MNFNVCKAAAFALVATSILAWSASKLEFRPANPAPAANSPPVRLTLIPDYENGIMVFEGSAPLDPASDELDVNWLPLYIDRTWPDEKAHTSYFMGRVKGGEIILDESGYHIWFDPVMLPPHRRLELSFPFVALDPAQVRLQPEPSDEDGVKKSRSPFSHEAGEAGQRIDTFYIPFQHIQKKIDLTLTPLAGEALAGNSNGLRLSGKVEFSSLTVFQTFRDYCLDPASTPAHPDFRRTHLLNVLDFSPFSGISGLPPRYRYQPTRLALRTELVRCQYDTANRIASVEAFFFGKVFPSRQGGKELPKELQEFLYPDGNYGYDLDPDHAGLEAYQIKLGKIVLGPGDSLAITVPHTQVLVESISPPPHDLIFSAHGRAQQPVSMVYYGPAAFELKLLYQTEMQLYLYQFPAILRPGLLWVESQFGNLFPFPGFSLTWVILGVGLVFLALSRWTENVRWLAALGWLLTAVGLYYGVRGSFGLLCMALIFSVSQIRYTNWTRENRAALIRRLVAGLAGFMLVTLGVYLDGQGALLFQGLSAHDLTPLTPLVFLVLVGALLWPLFGWEKSKSLTRSELPVLILFLAVLSLYDAFDKSLLALLILLTAGLYILHDTLPEKGGTTLRNKRRFGTELQKRWNRVFRNKTVVLAILVLMVFAVVNDLPRIFASPIQVSLPPLVAFLVIPFLVFVSVFLTFSSIALLFILVYPYLPFERGYQKALVFALVLFLVFLFGIGTDDRLIEFLPNLLIGRLIYYLSMPMLLGITFDIYEFMERENKQLSAQAGKKQEVTFRAAAGLYLKNFQGVFGTLAGIVSLVAPAVYGFFSSQPVIVTYFGLLQKLMLI